VLKYLSPVSQRIVTTVLPLPSSLATWAAAKQLAANVAAGELTADELRKCLADYLADDDRFVFKLGYALRHLPGRIDAYLNGSAKSQEAEPNAGAWER